MIGAKGKFYSETFVVEPLISIKSIFRLEYGF